MNNEVMTPEQIDQMPAGRKMDALLSEKIMGCEVTNLNGEPYTEWRGEDPDRLPERSTRIWHAWDVVEKMREDGWLFRLADSDEKGDVLAAFWKGDISGHARANTDSLAISRAALKAKLQEAALNKRGEM